MAWNRNVNTKMACKGVVANLIKTGVAISGCVFFAACGGDSGSKSSSAEIPPREVPSIYDLGSCTADREGDTVLVLDKSIEYLCLNNDWIDITTQPESSSDAMILSGDSAEQSSNSKEGASTESSSSSFIDDPLCGDCSSSSSAKATYIEVKIKDALGPCETADIGLRTLVLADSTYYTCKATGWVKDSSYPGYETVPARENLPKCDAGNAKQRILVKKDSVFFACDTEKWNPETADGYVVKNASILGAAQKGPFKFNSPLQLREVLLRNDSLIYSGRKYVDEISSNKGDFVIPKVNLVYPYAVLEVRGLWRNEVSGEYSKDSMTLRVLTDLTGRTEVNINLLTHLEYDRAARLVNKGYSVYAAKKQADYEIMTAFGFATSVEYSEDLKTFVPTTSENSGRNATLMAISLLFIGDRSEAEIQNAINSFKSDLAEDGEWDNGQMKADMADWAEAFDGGSVRANVKSWNILDIPDYENYLTIYWNNAYELGGCSATRSGVIAQNKNSKSKNYNVHYICKVTSWQKATDFEKDTYEWADGEEGEVKKGNVTATYYVFENGKWTVAKNETALGLCTASRNGEVGKIDTTYFICDNKNWRKATVLEYDTYLWTAGTEGEMKPGSVNSSNHYTYADGAWRATANDVEYKFGACVASRSDEKHIQSGKYYICESMAWKQITAEEYGLGYCTTSNSGVVENLNDVYYICKSGSWVTATVLEYDTYGWNAGTEGEMKPGSVVAANHYVFENGAWRASADEIEYNLGVCVTSRLNEVAKSGTTYYTCKSDGWTESTVLEYDTYKKYCPIDGSIVSGKVVSENKYVCDAGVFRTANELELSLNKGCVNYTENNKQYLNDKYYICENKVWKEISVTEYGLGYCTESRNGDVKKLNDVYYICKSENWTEATVLEYDTYGKTCSKDGTIVDGEVVAENKYVCDAGVFRELNNMELLVEKACVSYTENDAIRKKISKEKDSIYICRNSLWESSVFIYDMLTDKRDSNIYRTIVVGSQTWMAENLNYEYKVDGVSYGTYCNTDGCKNYGRYYTWAAAMDSAEIFTTNGKNCGYGRECTPTYPVRGICPEGWHLPTYTEWQTLITAVGGQKNAGKVLKSQSGWKDFNGNSCNGTDAYGFSALPAGTRYSNAGFGNVGNFTHFWSATQAGGYGNLASSMLLGYYNGADDPTSVNKDSGYSVRCLQD